MNVETVPVLKYWWEVIDPQLLLLCQMTLAGALLRMFWRKQFVVDYRYFIDGVEYTLHGVPIHEKPEDQ